MKNENIIYGLRAVIEAINANQPINKIFIQKGLKGELHKELESSARKNGISLSYVPIEKLNRFTVHGIIIPKNGAAPITDDTVKTSAGAAFNVPIAKVDHLKDAVFYLQSSGIVITGATEKAENDIYEVDFNQPTAIIMGSEEKGISPSTLSSIDHQAKLPLMGKIGSLNVSVACGVFLYEVVRQRKK